MGVEEWIFSWHFLAITFVAFVVITVIGRITRDPAPYLLAEKKRKEEEEQRKAKEQEKREEKKVFTLAEVEKHNKQEDCWLIIDGKVYDVTSFVFDHPGGASILKNAGKDNTVGFHGDQHPLRVADQLEEFYIGELAPTSAPASAAPNTIIINTDKS